MTMFTKAQLERTDLNIFFLINSIPVHIASMGTTIPQALNDSKRIAEDWLYVKSLPYSTNFRLNRDYLDRNATDRGYEYLSDERFGYMNDIHSSFPSMDAFEADVPLSVKLYSWSFVDMTRRGFFSFAPMENAQEEDGRIRFVLISRPIEPLPHRFDNLLEFHNPHFNIDGNAIENEGIFLLDMINQCRHI